MINDPFLFYYPSIDLHGFDRESAVVKINEFICDNIKLGNYNIIIIHGKGSGILRNIIHEYLSKNKNVVSFKLDNMNDGVTIVNIGENNEK